MEVFKADEFHDFYLVDSICFVDIVYLVCLVYIVYLVRVEGRLPPLEIMVFVEKLNKIKNVQLMNQVEDIIIGYGVSRKKCGQGYV